MSYNRLKFPLNEPFHNEEARAGEALVAVPTCFWSQLSPEQFRAQLAMYSESLRQGAPRSGRESIR